MYLLYGIDCRERGGLQGAVSYQKYIAVSAYRATISDDALEALRALDKAGINDSTFGGIENLPLRVEYYKLISNKLFSDVAANILDGLSTTAEKLTEDISALIDSRAKELYESIPLCLRFPSHRNRKRLRRISRKDRQSMTRKKSKNFLFRQ
ncbi:MAG: hypothetical protein ACLS4Z_00180 [Christensenellaceae bacterium]